MIRENQDKFISEMELFDNWQDKFQFLIDKAECLPVECSNKLLKHRFEFCQSKTCFCAENDFGKIKVDGWSNSAVMGGIVAAVMEIFNNCDVAELQNAVIDFHTKSGLIDNLTPLRQQSVEKMIAQIVLLSKT